MPQVLDDCQEGDFPKTAPERVRPQHPLRCDRRVEQKNKSAFVLSARTTAHELDLPSGMAFQAFKRSLTATGPGV